MLSNSLTYWIKQVFFIIVFFADFKLNPTTRSQTAFYYIFQSITVQFSTVSILHPAHRVTPTDWNEIQKVKRYIRVQSSIILMEREKGICLSWIAFSLVATHKYITFIVHHRRKKGKVKICHNFNKSASVYSEMLSFRCSDFQFKTKKKCTKVYMDSMWGRFCSIECEDLKERKDLSRIEFSQWLL